MSEAIRVLVAIDGSKSSEGTLQAVSAQFHPPEIAVRVLNVVQPLSVAVPPQIDAGFAPELEAQRNDARELVDRAAKSLAAAGFQAATEVREGDVREKILESAKDWRADLILVGSHGHKGLPHLLLGSVAEAVARHARCSVEVVRTPPSFAKVLLAVDDSKFSESAVQALMRQLRPGQAAISILHVVDLRLPIPTSDAGGFRQESLNRGRELVDRVKRQLAGAGIKAEAVIEEADPRSGIVDYAKKWGANLILTGSHGRKGIDHFLMGSVAEYVIRHAPCSVQIVRLA
ncbi:MAG: universal stress protein [Candidatus Acidiferrales bacterium]